MTSQTLADSNGKHINAELDARSGIEMWLVVVLIMGYRCLDELLALGCGLWIVGYGPWLTGNPLQLSIS